MNDIGAQGRDRWFDLVTSGSEMGELVAAHDWAAGPLGPPDSWPAALRAAVGICLTSRFPMLVVWGPQLIKIYNDGYVDILGATKHPGALGAPVKQVWPEVWDIIGPQFDHVMSGAGPLFFDQQMLRLEADGFLEERYFTYSYSPIFDEHGSIGGVFDTVVEVTQHVVAERRLRCLSELSAALVDCEHVGDVCMGAVTVMSRHPADIPAVAVYLRVNDELVQVASGQRHSLMRDLDPRVLREVLDSGRPLVIGAPAPGSPPVVLREGPTRPGPADRVVVPIGTDRNETNGVLVVGVSPHRLFDDAYRSFIDLAASSIGAALESSFRHAEALGQQRHISDTLQGAMLHPASDLPTVAARYLPAVGELSVGGDWYDVIDLGHGRRALVVGDCVGHGLPAATVMGQLRSASRALLLEGNGPAATLEALDRFAEAVDGARGTTVVCAIIDLAAGTVRYACAGHLPPLLMGRDTTTWLMGARGAPLATGERRRGEEAEAPLAEGDVLVLYSDGLVERRGEVLDVGLTRLAAAAAARRGSSVHDLADGLLEDLLAADARDDVALVVKVVPGQGVA